jgi:arsenate reductase
MAETILNSLGAKRFRAYSAGSHPAGSVNPIAIGWLKKNRFDTDSLRSKSWDEFAAPGAPVMDFVLTVCDNAAGEVCPVWPGQPISAHWGVEDPVSVQGTSEEKEKAFSNVFMILNRRISIFISLPFVSLDRISLHREVKNIGQS